MDNPYPQRIAKCGEYKKVSAEIVPYGWKLRFQWKKARAKVKGKNPPLMSDIQVLEANQGRYMGFIRVMACKKITIASCMQCIL